MERVQILLVVAFLFLVNIAQMADKILLMVCLLPRHQYLRNQVALLTIEYCRRQRRQPILLVTCLGLRFTTMTEGFLGIISESNRCIFDILLNVLRPAVTRENTRLRDCFAPEKILELILYRLAHGNSYESTNVKSSFATRETIHKNVGDDRNV